VGGTHLLAGKRLGEPIQTKGQTLWYSVYYSLLSAVTHTYIKYINNILEKNPLIVMATFLYLQYHNMEQKRCDDLISVSKMFKNVQNYVVSPVSQHGTEKGVMI
jgi:hypothetical protein